MGANLSMGAWARSVFCLVVVIVLGLVLPAAPAAARVRQLAPPGNSAITQYLETIPTAAGPQSTSGIAATGGGRASGGPSLIPAATLRALASQGGLGAADAATAEATAPSRGATGGSNHASGPGGAGPAAQPPAGPGPGTPGPGPVSSVFKALTGSSGSGGLGVFLPILLAGVFIVGGALAIWRRRRA